MPTVSMRPLRSPFHLEALLLDLFLSGGDGCIGGGVDETTALLAILQRGRLGGADALSGVLDLGAACGGAVRVGDTAAGDELRAVAGADVARASIVGGQSHGGGGDWIGGVSFSLSHTRLK